MYPASVPIRSHSNAYSFFRTAWFVHDVLCIVFFLPRRLYGEYLRRTDQSIRVDIPLNHANAVSRFVLRCSRKPYYRSAMLSVRSSAVFQKLKARDSWSFVLTLWRQLLSYMGIGYSYKASCVRQSYAVICNFWHPGTLTLGHERQSARMSKLTTGGLTRSGTGCCISVPIWQQWASKG